VRRILLLCLCLLPFVPVRAQDAAADRAWTRVQALQKGPGLPPEDAPEDAVRMARAHLQEQESVLSDFLVRFPADARRFEAELELASVSSALGASLSDRRRIESAIERLAALERSKSTPSKYRADAAFQRISTTMQTVNLAAASRPGETAAARNTIVEAAGNFASRYPDDRRAARLLAEVATILDDQPTRKRKLLEQASVLARDEGTTQRIKDDLRRLDLLGKVSDFSFDTVQGSRFSRAAQQGRIVVLVFWAGWSPPSVAWLADFAGFAKTLPRGRVVVATVSLDKVRSNCGQTLEALGIADWPTSFSGRGWEDPVAREFAINALPTVFIFDASGRLRAINARDTYQSVLRQLLSAKPVAP
jgi:thiol-disulfide isomerase/thioredoxin